MEQGSPSGIHNDLSAKFRFGLPDLRRKAVQNYPPMYRKSPESSALESSLGVHGTPNLAGRALNRASELEQ
jgi:hypothetical protein